MKPALMGSAAHIRLPPEDGTASIIPPPQDRYFPRGPAAEYLSALLGRQITEDRLAKLASDGTGPRYVIILGRASYRIPWLHEWVEQVTVEGKDAVRSEVAKRCDPFRRGRAARRRRLLASATPDEAA